MRIKEREVRMRIKERFTQIKAVAVAVVGFIRRHKRASIAVALVVRRFVRANERRQAAQARQANCRCRCRCHRQQQTQQHGGRP